MPDAGKYGTRTSPASSRNFGIRGKGVGGLDWGPGAGVPTGVFGGEVARGLSATISPSRRRLITSLMHILPARKRGDAAAGTGVAGRNRSLGCDRCRTPLR